MSKRERQARYEYLWKREYRDVRRFKRWARTCDKRLTFVRPDEYNHA